MSKEVWFVNVDDTDHVTGWNATEQENTKRVVIDEDFSGKFNMEKLYIAINGALVIDREREQEILEQERLNQALQALKEQEEQKRKEVEEQAAKELLKQQGDD